MKLFLEITVRGSGLLMRRAACDRSQPSSVGCESTGELLVRGVPGLLSAEPALPTGHLREEISPRGGDMPRRAAARALRLPRRAWTEPCPSELGRFENDRSITHRELIRLGPSCRPSQGVRQFRP